jgi:hypothetical protein
MKNAKPTSFSHLDEGALDEGGLATSPRCINFPLAMTARPLSPLALVTAHPRLDISHLMCMGALTPGASTELQWEAQGTGGTVRASEGRLELTGAINQVIAFEWLPVVAGRYVRPRFRCPSCGRGAYRLRLKAGMFACWRCCQYGHRSRLDEAMARRLLRVRKIRAQLRADARLGSPIERPRGMARVRYERLVEALNRAELSVYASAGRELRSRDNGRHRDRDGRGAQPANL